MVEILAMVFVHETYFLTHDRNVHITLEAYVPIAAVLLLTSWVCLKWQLGNQAFPAYAHRSCWFLACWTVGVWFAWLSLGLFIDYDWSIRMLGAIVSAGVLAYGAITKVRDYRASYHEVVGDRELVFGRYTGVFLVTVVALCLMSLVGMFWLNSNYIKPASFSATSISGIYVVVGAIIARVLYVLPYAEYSEKPKVVSTLALLTRPTPEN